MVVFPVLSVFFYNDRPYPFFRKETLTDTIYWFFGLFFYHYIRILLIAAVVWGIYAGDSSHIDDLQGYGREGVRDLPVWLQAILILLLGDFYFYWTHRMLHRTRLWKYHAIHHSPKTLDWLSGVRFHPINIFITGTLFIIPFLYIGFSPEAITTAGLFSMASNFAVHANLRWALGPLKYVFVSPVCHRWHHTMPEEGGDKNFAAMFSFYDVLFGTFYMPKGKRPHVYGVREEIPESFWGQLVYPFQTHTDIKESHEQH